MTSNRFPDYVPKISLQEKAYQTIRGWLADGLLSKGSITSEMQLSGMLDMSRTPIRSALQRLELEGYVRIAPKQGILILDQSAARISGLFDVIASLVLYAVESARSGKSNELSQIAKLYTDEFRIARKKIKAEGMDSGMPETFAEKELTLCRSLIDLLHNKEYHQVFELAVARLNWFSNFKRWDAMLISDTFEYLDELLQEFHKPSQGTPPAPSAFPAINNYFNHLKRTWQ